MENILAKIKPKVPRCSSLVIYSSDTKTIPFTVPTSAPPYGRRCDSIGESGRSSSCDSQPGTPPIGHRDTRSASPRVGAEPFYMSDTRGESMFIIFTCHCGLVENILTQEYRGSGFYPKYMHRCIVAWTTTKSGRPLSLGTIPSGRP